MTVHAAKGLEFDTAFITGMEEGLFPHMNCQDDAGIEEERRLFYVALTRARKRAVVTWARSRARAGSWEMSRASRFLSDLDPETVHHGQVRQRRSFKDVLRQEGAAPEEAGVIGPKATGKRVVHSSLGQGIVLGVIGQAGAAADVMVRLDSGEIRVVKAGALRLTGK
jgi:DNA helicase-2/ATP-dependent DNA helicase PcrA